MMNLRRVVQPFQVTVKIFEDPVFKYEPVDKKKDIAGQSGKKEELDKSSVEHLADRRRRLCDVVVEEPLYVSFV
jgi:hypothetical protein